MMVQVRIFTIVEEVWSGGWVANGLMSLLVRTTRRYQFQVVSMTLNRLVPPTTFLLQLFENSPSSNEPSYTQIAIMKVRRLQSTL